MKNKLVRAFAYVAEFLKILFFLPAGALCARFCRKYSRLWLICERGDDARDNGYRFYEYLKREHPEINCRYVISSDSPDAEKLQKLGGAVEYKSFRHYLSYFSASFLIGTHVQPCAPDKIMYYHLARSGIRARAKQVFLQHGITLSDMSWLNAKSFYTDLFVCGAKPEYEHIRREYGHPEGVVRYLGLCRFDELSRADARDKMILLMPTWRGSKYPCGKEFLNTEYYKHFSELLNSRELARLLEENDLKLFFYPHIEMQKYIGDFKTELERVIIADSKHYDVQKLLLSCSMLITDYSSVFFDVAYLKKPVIYYQFDEEEFHTYHYKKGYFDFRRDGFGPVCVTLEELLHATERTIERDFVLEKEYLDRGERFFELRDTDNCKRTFDAVRSLENSKK